MAARCIILLAWLSSSNRRRFPLRLVVSGLLAQLLLAALFLKVPLLQDALLLVNRLMLTLEAIVRGTGEGLRLLATIIGMLIVFVWHWCSWSGLLATCMTGCITGLIL